MKLRQDSVKLYKRLVILMILLISVVCCSGELFLSEVTNNVYIGVCGISPVNFEKSEWVTNGVPLRYDDRLVIMAFCRTGAVNLLIPLESRIYIRFQMQDIVKKEIARTSMGQQWGDDIEHFPRRPGMNKHDRMSEFRVLGSHTNGISNFSSVGPILPSPKDLFEMKGPGIYELTLEVHLMKQHMLGTNNWTWDQIVIPPVTVKVEKPPDKH